MSASEAIIEALQKRLAQDPKAMIGNKGYRKYLKISGDSISIDTAKIEEESTYDGKWVLETNSDLPSEKVALRYKELWQVEYVFRDLKSILETRPIFHQRGDTIRGHVFCTFLALLLKKELFCRLEEAGHDLEWSDIVQDLEALQETVIEENGSRLTIRTECQGTCSKIFQAVRVAVPPMIREVAIAWIFSFKGAAVVPNTISASLSY